MLRLLSGAAPAAVTAAYLRHTLQVHLHCEAGDFELQGCLVRELRDVDDGQVQGRWLIQQHRQIDVQVADGEPCKVTDEHL